MSSSPENRMAEQFVPTGKRTRASKPKVKTGCITCKIRRVKCDEEKPECLKCRSTGRICDGYKSTETNERTPDSAKLSFQEQNISLSRSLPTDDYGSIAERRALDFFRHRTAVEAAGYFESEFWTQLVLQLSQSELAIRHAVAALGSIHERIEQTGMPFNLNDLTDENWQFTINQYNKSVGLLAQNANAPTRLPVEVLLTACILFVCIELLRGNYAAGNIHLESGIRILYDWRYNRFANSSKEIRTHTANPRFEEDKLLHLFIRLDIQSSFFVKRSPTLYTILQERGCVALSLSKPFTDLREARISLDYLIGAVIQFAMPNGDTKKFTPGCEPEIMTERDRLCIMLQQWSQAFELFMARRSTVMTSEDKQASSLLVVYYKVLKIAVFTRFFTTEVEYDSYLDEFRAILSICSAMFNENIRSHTASSPAQPPFGKINHMPSFTLGMGIIPPLFFTAWKCRDAFIRKPAYAIIASSPHREGFWDGNMLSVVTERIISVEEVMASAGGSNNGGGSGHSSDIRHIPESARVHRFVGDTRDVNRPREGVLSYYFRRDDREGGWLVKQEEVSW